MSENFQAAVDPKDPLPTRDCEYCEGDGNLIALLARFIKEWGGHIQLAALVRLTVILKKLDNVVGDKADCPKCDGGQVPVEKGATR